MGYKEANKKFYEKNKHVVIECDCGSKINTWNRSAHLKTKKHKIMELFKKQEKMIDKLLGRTP